MKLELGPKMPHLAQHVTDMGPLEIFMIDADVKGRAHNIWLVDGEVNNPIEFSDFLSVPKTTFAVQLEIIPLEDAGQVFFGWNLLQLFVIGDYNPNTVAREIQDFASKHDAFLVAHFIAGKIGNPQNYDPRTRRAESLEQYLGILEHLKGKSFALSTKRQVGELEHFLRQGS